MIESLDGIFETVNYKENTSIRLYDNDETENYPSHWHTTMEVIMPINNYYTVDTGNETINLRQGDIIIIAPGCIHSLYAPPEGGRRIIFQPDVSFLYNNMSDLETVCSAISPLVVITPEDFPDIHPKISRLLLEIREEYLNGNRFSEMIIYSKFLEVLVLIGRYYTNAQDTFSINPNKQQEYIEKFLQICDYINTHCTDDLTLDDVAELSGFSKFYFTRLFKQFTHMSFYKYLNQKRIAYAEQLLIDPKNSVTDVALNSGFSSISSFIRMFKIVKGCTPTEFRNTYQAR